MTNDEKIGDGAMEEPNAFTPQKDCPATVSWEPP